MRSPKSGHLIDNCIAINYVNNDKDDYIHFLTHIETGTNHGDVSRILSPTAKTIYTTKFNAWILKEQFKHTRNIFPIDEEKSYKIETEETMFVFTCLRSYYNTGSMMVLIKGKFGSVLYTGYCCYSDKWLLNPILAGIHQRRIKLDKLYADFTYFDHKTDFLNQDEVVNLLCEFLRKNENKRYYMHIPFFGMEDFLVKVSFQLKEKFVVDEKQMFVYKLLNMEECFSCDTNDGRITVTSSQILKRVKNKEPHELIFLIMESGFRSNFGSYRKVGEKVHIFTVYGHSCKTELDLMVRKLPATFLTPIYNNKDYDDLPLENQADKCCSPPKNEKHVKTVRRSRTMIQSSDSEIDTEEEDLRDDPLEDLMSSDRQNQPKFKAFFNKHFLSGSNTSKRNDNESCNLVSEQPIEKFTSHYGTRSKKKISDSSQLKTLELKKKLQKSESNFKNNLPLNVSSRDSCGKILTDSDEVTKESVQCVSNDETSSTPFISIDCLTKKQANSVKQNQSQINKSVHISPSREEEEIIILNSEDEKEMICNDYTEQPNIIDAVTALSQDLNSLNTNTVEQGQSEINACFVSSGEKEAIIYLNSDNDEKKESDACPSDLPNKIIDNDALPQDPNRSKKESIKQGQSKANDSNCIMTSGKKEEIIILNSEDEEEMECNLHPSDQTNKIIDNHALSQDPIRSKKEIIKQGQSQVNDSTCILMSGKREEIIILNSEDEEDVECNLHSLLSSDLPNKIINDTSLNDINKLQNNSFKPDQAQIKEPASTILSEEKEETIVLEAKVEENIELNVCPSDPSNTIIDDHSSCGPNRLRQDQSQISESAYQLLSSGEKDATFNLKSTAEEGIEQHKFPSNAHNKINNDASSQETTKLKESNSLPKIRVLSLDSLLDKSNRHSNNNASSWNEIKEESPISQINDNSFIGNSHSSRMYNTNLSLLHENIICHHKSQLPLNKQDLISNQKADAPSPIIQNSFKQETKKKVEKITYIIGNNDIIAVSQENRNVPLINSSVTLCDVPSIHKVDKLKCYRNRGNKMFAKNINQFNGGIVKSNKFRASELINSDKLSSNLDKKSPFQSSSLNQKEKDSTDTKIEGPTVCHYFEGGGTCDDHSNTKSIKIPNKGKIFNPKYVDNYCLPPSNISCKELQSNFDENLPVDVLKTENNVEKSPIKMSIQESAYPSVSYSAFLSDHDYFSSPEKVNCLNANNQKFVKLENNLKKIKNNTIINHNKNIVNNKPVHISAVNRRCFRKMPNICDDQDRSFGNSSAKNMCTKIGKKYQRKQSKRKIDFDSISNFKDQNKVIKVEPIDNKVVNSIKKRSIIIIKKKKNDSDTNKQEENSQDPVNLKMLEGKLKKKSLMLLSPTLCYKDESQEVFESILNQLDFGDLVMDVMSDNTSIVNFPQKNDSFLSEDKIKDNLNFQPIVCLDKNLSNSGYVFHSTIGCYVPSSVFNKPQPYSSPKAPPLGSESTKAKSIDNEVSEAPMFKDDLVIEAEALGSTVVNIENKVMETPELGSTIAKVQVPDVSIAKVKTNDDTNIEATASVITVATGESVGKNFPKLPSPSRASRTLREKVIKSHSKATRSPGNQLIESLCSTATKSPDHTLTRANSSMLTNSPTCTIIRASRRVITKSSSNTPSIDENSKSKLAKPVVQSSIAINIETPEISDVNLSDNVANTTKSLNCVIHKVIKQKDPPLKGSCLSSKTSDIAKKACLKSKPIHKQQKRFLKRLPKKYMKKDITQMSEDVTISSLKKNSNKNISKPAIKENVPKRQLKRTFKNNSDDSDRCCKKIVNVSSEKSLSSQKEVTKALSCEVTKDSTEKYSLTKRPKRNVNQEILYEAVRKLKTNRW